MGSMEMQVGRVFIVRVEHDSELMSFIANLAKKHHITSATFAAIGALKSAKLGFYDQLTHEYMEDLLVTPQEVASCTGNVSLKDGMPFVHAHAVLSDQSGNTRGGHLIEGKVFAAEVHLFELLGEKVERKKDDVTDLSLWDI
jgi:uncharacterized protein